MFKNVLPPPRRVASVGIFLALVAFISITACTRESNDLESSVQSQLSVADKTLMQIGEKSAQAAVSLIAENMSTVGSAEELETMALSEISKNFPKEQVEAVYQGIKSNPSFQESMTAGKQKLAKANIGTEEDLLTKAWKKAGMNEQTVNALNDYRGNLYDIQEKLKALEAQGTPLTDAQIASTFKNSMIESANNIETNPNLRREDKIFALTVIRTQIACFDATLQIFKNRKNQPNARTEVYADCSDFIECVGEFIIDTLGGGAVGASVGAYIGGPLGAAIGAVVGFFVAVICFFWC